MEVFGEVATNITVCPGFHLFFPVLAESEMCHMLGKVKENHLLYKRNGFSITVFDSECNRVKVKPIDLTHKKISQKLIQINFDCY